VPSIRRLQFLGGKPAVVLSVKNKYNSQIIIPSPQKKKHIGVISIAVLITPSTKIIIRACTL
jgi:hypothetical protein